MSVPKATESAAIVAVKVTPADPSKETLPVKSPPKVIVLAVANLEAVEALPDRDPVILVAIKLETCNGANSKEA